MNARSRRLPGAPFWIPGVLVAGVLLSLALHRHLRLREHHDATEAAATLAHQQIERLHISILRSLEVLHSVAALHAAHGHLDRPLFRAFVHAALARQPELQALSWNPAVPHAQRAGLEHAAVADGLPEFTFREAAPEPDGRLVPARPRPDYVPVYFIEPQAPNQTALGFDLASDSSRRASLEQARDSGLAVATTPIRLAQGPGNTAGLLVLLPVFHGPTPATPDQRRQRLAGFAVAVFRIPTLVGNAFRELRQLGLRAELFDDSPAGERIFSLDSDSPPSSPPPAGSLATLEVAGRRWAVVFAPTADFAPTRTPPASLWALIIGLIFTSSTCAHLGYAGRRTRDVARANAALEDEVAIRQRAEAAAAAANRAKSDFLTSMSHEIRTPLSAILGYAQLMQRDSRLPPEPRDAAHGIQISGQHLLGLINEVLDLAKIEAGRMELHTVDFDLARLASGIATTFRPLCHEKRLAFHLHLHLHPPQPPHPTPLPVVRGDEGKLRQILINLVGNAVKFTRAGEIQLHVRPLASPPDHWLFEVLDTGLGIPESERPAIFEPFHQGSGAAHQGGTGLGLAIAQRQVRLLGGSLAFESERGVGSRFHFHIPLPPATQSQPSAPSAPSVPSAPSDLSDSPHPSPPPSLPPPPRTPVPLPAPLFARLTLAAELHSSTALKACLVDLRELGPDAARLAEELRWLLRSYDMQGIQRALARAYAQPALPDPAPVPSPLRSTVSP